jgi:carbamoyltransferase
MFEEAVFGLYRTLHARHRTDAIAIAGGCGFNSVANGRLYSQTPFKRAYVQSAAGDAGGAIGAACAVWGESGGGRRFAMDHAYWGPAYDDEACRRAIAARQVEIDTARCTIVRESDEDALCLRVAGAIARGKVVGWFQGRMEWGPRALGNRAAEARQRLGEGVGPARARQPLDPRRPAPGRHEGRAQLEDQTARIVPALCTLGSARSLGRVVRDRR